MTVSRCRANYPGVGVGKKDDTDLILIRKTYLELFI